MSEIEDVLNAAAPLIELAITEDIGPGDATSEATLPAAQVLHGYIVAKAAGVLTIHAAEAHAAGVEFYRADEAVYLAEQSPPEFLEA